MRRFEDVPISFRQIPTPSIERVIIYYTLGHLSDISGHSCILAGWRKDFFDERSPEKLSYILPFTKHGGYTLSKPPRSRVTLESILLEYRITRI